MYYCSYEGCDKSFTNKHSLKRHRVTHDPNKKFKCDVWSKMFSLPQYLKEHKVVHTSERPYTWKFPGWGKSFRQAGKLSIHRKEHQNSHKLQRNSNKYASSPLTLSLEGGEYPELWLNQNLSETWNLINHVQLYYCWCDFPNLSEYVLEMRSNIFGETGYLPFQNLSLASSYEQAYPLSDYYPNVPY